MKTNTKVNIVFGLAIVTGVSVGWLFLSSDEMMPVKPANDYQVHSVTRVESEANTAASPQARD